jgi:hypothetical protein
VIASNDRSSTRWSAVVTALFLLLSTLGSTGQNAQAGVHVEMDSQQLQSFRLTVTSAAATRVTFYKYLLPWGNVNSIILVAVTARGETLQRDMPIDDPSADKISLNPNESVSGSIDLRKAFRGLDRALATSDVNLFWAYNAPKELGIATRSGGWVLLRQRR